jgi:subtilase family serine protease
MVARLGLLVLAATTLLASPGWAQSVALHGNRSAAVDEIAVAGDAPPDRVLTMRIDLRPGDEAALDNLLAAQQDPAAPQYHQWLRPGEFAQRFGPAPSLRAAISGWLERQGFAIRDDPAHPFAIHFTGTVLQAERAFGVAIRSTPDGQSYGNVNDPSVPAQFAGAIAFIDGLDNLRGGSGGVAAGLDRTRHRPSRAMGAAFHNGQTGFGPEDFYTFYKETPLLNDSVDGSGRCIGVIEIGDYDPTGVTNFDTVFNLPAATVTRVVSTNSNNPGLDDRSAETMADLLYAHSIAPGAGIIVYLSNPATYSGNVITSTVDSLDTAVTADTCGALSISIESCGFPDSFYTGALHTTYMQAAAQGQTVFVAEGDQGAAEYQYDASTKKCAVGTSRNVNELASDPFVTSIGGTQFDPNYDSAGNDVGHVPQSVWNEEAQKGGAGGGGASAVFSKPFFQDVGTPADKARDVPDISMESAATHPGAFSVFPLQKSASAVVCCFAGTSLGAPIWAGITALMIQYNKGERVGTINPRLYSLGNQRDTKKTGIRSVTMGNNNFNGVTGFQAKPGYNQATGWGTPDIATFVRAYVNGRGR